jgi:uncharacterized protein
MVDYKQEIQDIKQQVINKYKPERIILFGSAARDEFKKDSDIDMLIVKKTDKRKFDRLCELRRLLDYNLPLDLIVYTPEEMELATQQGNDFVKAIYDEGVVLYE